MPTVLDFQIPPGKDNRYPVEVFKRHSFQPLAGSLHQIAMIHHERKAYQEALEMYIKSLNIFSELQSPDANKVINFLIQLRTQWGAEHFDAAWKERTGAEVPGWLIGEIGGIEEGKSV